MIPAWRIKLDVIVLTLGFLAWGLTRLVFDSTSIILPTSIIFWSCVSELFYRKWFNKHEKLFRSILVGYTLLFILASTIDHTILLVSILGIGLAFSILFYLKSIHYLIDWINRPRSFWDLV